MNEDETFENTYIFINAWTAPADSMGSDMIRAALLAITTAYLTDSLREPMCIIGLGPATRGADPLGPLSPFLLVEDQNGENFFVKKEEIAASE